MKHLFFVALTALIGLQLNAQNVMMPLGVRLILQSFGTSRVFPKTPDHTAGIVFM